MVFLGTGCAAYPKPVELPQDETATVMVMSAALGGPMKQVARHPWIAARPRGSSAFERWEVMCCPSSTSGTVRHSHRSPLSDHGGGGGDVQVHAVIRGTAATSAIECIRREAEVYPYDDEYLVWPGPNSNTFVDWMVRTCALDVELPSTSIGRDFRGYIGASTTAGGTGVQLETPLLGVKLGLTEGVELHVWTLALGIDLWPPAIIVPVGDGRLGFADR
jgi:hypothetical protein